MQCRGKPQSKQVPMHVKTSEHVEVQRQVSQSSRPRAPMSISDLNIGDSKDANWKCKWQKVKIKSPNTVGPTVFIFSLLLTKWHHFKNLKLAKVMHRWCTWDRKMQFFFGASNLIFFARWRHFPAEPNSVFRYTLQYWARTSNGVIVLVVMAYNEIKLMLIWNNPFSLLAPQVL